MKRFINILVCLVLAGINIEALESKNITVNKLTKAQKTKLSKILSKISYILNTIEKSKKQDLNNLPVVQDLNLEVAVDVFDALKNFVKKQSTKNIKVLKDKIDEFDIGNYKYISREDDIFLVSFAIKLFSTCTNYKKSLLFPEKTIPNLGAINKATSLYKKSALKFSSYMYESNGIEVFAKKIEVYGEGGHAEKTNRTITLEQRKTQLRNQHMLEEKLTELQDSYASSLLS